MNWLAAAGWLGAFAVTMGAFGAHAFPPSLEGRGYDEAEIAKRADTYETGARYQMYAALTLAVIGLATRANPKPSGWWRFAGWFTLVGGLGFGGLLYALAYVDGMRWLGAIVPIFGLSMILSWICVAVGAMKKPLPAD